MHLVWSIKFAFAFNILSFKHAKGILKYPSCCPKCPSELVARSAMLSLPDQCPGISSNILYIPLRVHASPPPLDFLFCPLIVSPSPSHPTPPASDSMASPQPAFLPDSLPLRTLLPPSLRTSPTHAPHALHVNPRAFHTPCASRHAIPMYSVSVASAAVGRTRRGIW